MNKNRGFTIVETIITIALMAIMTGVLAYSMSLIYSKDVKNCADSIDNQLTKLRLNTMSVEGSWKMTLEYRDEKVFLHVYKNDATYYSEEFSERIKITYEDTSGNVYRLSDSRVLEISFDSSMGAFNSDICRIDISDGVRDKSVVLVKLTGTHYVE